MRKAADAEEFYAPTPQGRFREGEIGGSVPSIILILSCFFLLSAFSLQPMEERKEQEALPMSQNPLWQQLQKTKVTADEKSGYFNAKIPPEVKALSGKELTVNGFMMPLENTDKFKHFLLAKRTPTCPFCPPGEPNEIIDVWTKKPVAYDDAMVTVKGTFELMNDRDMGLFFKLKNATETSK